jgi:hypothetical protein
MEKPIIVVKNGELFLKWFAKNGEILEFQLSLAGNKKGIQKLLDHPQDFDIAFIGNINDWQYKDQEIVKSLICSCGNTKLVHAISGKQLMEPEDDCASESFVMLAMFEEQSPISYHNEEVVKEAKKMAYDFLLAHSG